jgi:Zn-dependent metalloprotease
MGSKHTCCHIVSSSMLRKLAQHPDFTDVQREILSRSADAAAFVRGERSVAQFAALASVRTSDGIKHREVYDGGGKRRLPGKRVRSEGDKPAVDHPAANDAYDSTGTTYDFYLTVLQRNSIDAHGLSLTSTVHSGKAPNNAFWDGRQMVFGDAMPNGPFVGSFASALDVVAHELTHGVTQYAVPGGGGLEYEEQSGALNESWSDVFGSVIKQWAGKQDVTQANWLIGETIWNPAFGTALRSMKAPGTTSKWDDQPKDMAGYVQNGDVHTNSGIPNHAFYLAATALGGSSWEKAGPIWYKALSALTFRATFTDAAKATIDAARALYGQPEAEAVAGAWRTVKVL